MKMLNFCIVGSLNKSILALLLGAVIFFASCSKKTDAAAPQTIPPPPVSVPDTTTKEWQLLTAPAGILDIGFTSPARGFVFHRNTISRSLDSGKTWTEIPFTGLKPDLVSFNWLDTKYGHGAGTREFAYTADGGDSWVVKPMQETGLDVAFCSPARGVVCTERGLYMTADTGNKWRPVLPGKWTAAAFVDATHGWAAGQSGIWSTEDGGESWNRKTTMAGTIYTLFFIDRQTGWYVTNGTDSTNKFVWRTTDGGNTWSGSSLPSSSAFDIQFVNKQTGYATANNKIVKSTDGGVSWQVEIELSPSHRLVELHFLNEHFGWAHTMTGNVVRFKK